MKVKNFPNTNAENVIQGEKFRISVLTPELIRLEYSENGIFEDRATQTVWNRNFDKVSFFVTDTKDEITIQTSRLRLQYDKKAFSSNGLIAKGKGKQHEYDAVWHYGDNWGNLGGTARTLDDVNGACDLSVGIMSRTGYAVLDDSKSLILNDNNEVEPRITKTKDIYLFAYGHDYERALADFYYLTGDTPMLPRFALGNWWSRYYAYTEQSYKELVEGFKAENIPFSVAVIDMDWHLVDDVDPVYGTGWTGYTWNKKLFPDPKGFLAWLHEQGMRTTLNLHPADGIRAYEECYPQIAKAMGVDETKGEPVDFDVANPKFLPAYFENVLHPMEEDGVDFWWIDWQQGNNTKIPGLDPLWMLNHYHYLDSGRDNKRPMTFSRYAGPGSHRYPVGFSGDTHMTWESLDFQPYFTNTASNIGYGWWSHDIGGHMKGYKDDEMALRWLQYGVFSPINRLHSSNNEFNGKEPWRYPMEIHQIMNRYLRLRHQMIPYLYTMNYRAFKERKPIIEPMYYVYPQNQEAYEVQNQYLFGSELIVAPITSPQIPKLHMGKVKAWLPGGLYFDIFTQTWYRGNRFLNLYRSADSIPVFAKAGAILPMTDELTLNYDGKKNINNPKNIIVHVYTGADGEYTLYEDDNESQNYMAGHAVFTKMNFSWEEGKFTIFPAWAAHAEDFDLIPKERSFTIIFHGIEDCLAEADNKAAAQYDKETSSLTVTLTQTSVMQKQCICLSKVSLAANQTQKQIFNFLNQAEIDFALKEKIYHIACSDLSAGEKSAELVSMELDKDLTGCIIEFLTAMD